MRNNQAVISFVRPGSGLIIMLTLMFAVVRASADSAAMLEFPDGRTAMPVKTVEISMDAESVAIVPSGKASHRDLMMDVTCVFYLTNLTDDTLDISVGFPFESFYGTLDNMTVRDYENGGTSYIVDNVTEVLESDIDPVSMVPEWLDFRSFADGIELEVYYRKGVINPEERLLYWPVTANWQMHFEPGQTVRLVNTYTTSWNHFSYFGYTYSLTYVTRSGSVWAGTIGDAVITLTVPEPIRMPSTSWPTALWNWTGSPEVEGRTITWHYRYWEPSEDISFTVSGGYIVDERAFLPEYGWEPDEIIWTENELYSSAISLCSYMSAEMTALLLLNIAGTREGVTPDDYYYFPAWVAGPAELQDERSTLVHDLDSWLGEQRLVMESAGLEFLLPMVVLQRDWSDVNLDMYAANHSRQARYLLALENLEDAILGERIIDPSVSSLYWLSGWIIPGEPINNLERYLDRTPILSQTYVREYWMNSSLPLVLCCPAVSTAPEFEADVNIQASTHLSVQAGNRYIVGNLTDGNSSTAWIEGADGYGYGETITLSLAEACIAGGFTLMNGYCSSEAAWENNSRVRKFLVYKDSSPVFVLELEDTMDTQRVQFPEAISFDVGDEITLEILEVYPGVRYADTAISELRITKDLATVEQ